MKGGVQWNTVYRFLQTSCMCLIGGQSLSKRGLHTGVLINRVCELAFGVHRPSTAKEK